MSFERTSLEGEIDVVAISGWSLWQSEKQTATIVPVHVERCLYTWAKTGLPLRSKVLQDI